MIDQAKKAQFNGWSGVGLLDVSVDGLREGTV